MKSRFFFVAILVVGLWVILVSGVAAQASYPDIKDIEISGANFPLPGDSYVFLPLILKNYPTCTIAPTLISPSNAENLDTLIPVLSFEKYNEAAIYTKLIFDDNDSFESPITYTLGGGFPGVYDIQLMENLDPATTYYWYVYDICDSIESPYSQTFSFTTGSDGVILPPPTLISPPDGSDDVGEQPTLTWGVVDGAVGYKLYTCIANSSCFVRLTTQTSAIAYSFVDPALEYWWFVTAYNNYAYGDWSEVWALTIGPSSTLRNEGVEKKYIDMDFLNLSLEDPWYIYEIKH